MSDPFDRRLLLKGMALAAMFPEFGPMQGGLGSSSQFGRMSAQTVGRAAAPAGALVCPPVGQDPGEQLFHDGPEWPQLLQHLQELFGAPPLSGDLPREMLNLHALLSDGSGLPAVDTEKYRYLQ